MLTNIWKERRWGLKRIILLSLLPIFLLAATLGVVFNYFATQESSKNLIIEHIEQHKMELKFIANIPTLKTFVIDLRLGLHEEAAFFKQEIEDTLEQFFSESNKASTYTLLVVTPTGDELLRIVNGKVVPPSKETIHPDILHHLHHPLKAHEDHLSVHSQIFAQSDLTYIDEWQLLDPINNEMIGGLIYEYQIPLAHILDAPRRIMWFNIFYSFAGILALFSIFSLIINYHIQPLNLLTIAVRRIIEGNLDQKVDSVGSGETLTLAESFEQMRSRLQESFVEIYKKNSELANSLAELKQSEEKLATTLNSIGDGVFATDENGLVVNMNPVAEKMCGWNLAQAKGKPLSEIFVIVNAKTRKSCTNPVSKVLNLGKVVGLANHTTLIAKNGSEYQIADSAAPIRNPNGEITGVVLVVSDVTEKYAQQEKLAQAQEELTKNLEHQLYVDELTKLGSRARLLKDIKECKNPALVLIDINSFRTINELYGIEVGNEVLILFSNILKNFASLKKYQLYRIAGDEFVLLRDTSNTNALLCEDLLSKLFKLIKKTSIAPSLLGEPLYVEISAGASFETTNPLGTANIALNYAKQHYKPYVVFNKEMDSFEEVSYGVLWKKKIIVGIQEKAFLPFFQPIVDREQNIVKYEALMRFREVDNSYVSPYSFLDIAVKTRHYNEISQMTMLKSLLVCAKKKITISLNLNYQDILNTELCQLLKKVLHVKGIGERVIFEIVESQDIQNYDILKAFIAEFKALGVRFAIDDFGTGFSNFTHIFELSPDFIKIDGSLIKNIDTNKKSFELVKAIVFFSKEMGIQTVAEFVHSKEVFQIALDLGIDYFQGYYFGAPCEKIS